MAFGWILSLAPIADELIQSIDKKVRFKKKKEEWKKEVKEKFTTLYKGSIKDIRRDITILSSWKKIVGTAQGLNTKMSTWNLIVNLAIDSKDISLIFKVLNVKKVEELKKVISSTRDSIVALKTKDGKISWMEGGADLISAFDKIILDLTQMITRLKSFEKRIASKDKTFDADDLGLLSYLIGNVMGNNIIIFNYWDGFQESLFENIKKAPTHFGKGLEDSVDFAIDIPKDETSYQEILKKIGDILPKE